MNQDVAVVRVNAVPPSWANRRGHWRKSWSAKKVWRTRSHLAAQEARVLAGWSLPREGDLAKVTIVLHRVRMLDHDNAYSSVKPCLDGLQGALIYSDAPQFCELSVHQQQVFHFADQQMVITVQRQ